MTTLLTTFTGLLALLPTVIDKPDPPRQATGILIGEVSPTSAIVRVRHTLRSTRNETGIRRSGRPIDPIPTDDQVGSLLHSAPGARGSLQLRVSQSADLAHVLETDPIQVDETTDYSHQFVLEDLSPNTLYFLESSTADEQGVADQPLRAQFRTAPRAETPSRVLFTVVTGQMYKDVDDNEGFKIYDAMKAIEPSFLVPTGDTVYYDNEDPRARTIPLARYHWHRMYSFPKLVAFHQEVPGYWMKDDHDLLSNDCWPGLDPAFMKPLTFEAGLRLFREQVPMGTGPSYRTYRWGKDLQVWLVEGRDYRSPNPMPDGPEKSIWGQEQKAWLRQTMLESDATWKVLISPTPIVGPDRGNKKDNHANSAFQHEGEEIRRWLADNLPENAFVACGDRHWQYHSVDPRTGLHEFSCGPASDEHAGGSPGFDNEYHQFHRVDGGFLSVLVDRADGPPTIAFRFHSVDGEIVYQHKFTSR